jgi:ABC-2 type transport system permease protein
VEPRRVLAVVLRQFYLFRGSAARLMPLFVWVAVDMVLWGFMTRYLNSVAGARIDFVPQLLGAVLLWDFFTRVMQGVTLAFFEDVWSRNFLNLFASPMSVGEYVAGLVMSSIATSAIGLAVMFLLATTVFRLSLLAYGAPLVAFLVVLFAFGVALGIVACALVLRLGPAAEWFVWPIPALVSPLAGVFYPIATLPSWLRPVAAVLPPSYVFENLRRIVGGSGASPGELLLSAGLAALYIAFAAWIFTRVYRHAVRTGLIARYSAESVS